MTLLICKFVSGYKNRLPEIYVPRIGIRLAFLLAWLFIMDSRVGAQEYPITNITDLSTRQILDTTRVAELLQQAELLQKSNPDSALTLYKSIITSSRAGCDYYGIARSMLNIGRLFLDQMKNRESQEILTHAIPYCRMASAQNPMLLPLAYNALAGAHIRQGNNDSAFYYLYQAYSGFPKNDDRHYAALGGIYINMASLLVGTLQIKQSFYYLNKAYVLAAKAPDRRLLSVVYKTTANLYKQIQQWDSSLYYQNKALQLDLSLNDLTEVQTIYSDIAAIYLDKKEPGIAALFLDSAIRIKKEGAINNASLQRRLGWLHYIRSQYKDASVCFERALKLNREKGERRTNLHIYNTLASLYSKTGQYKQAYKAQRSFSELLGNLASERMVKAANEMEVKYRLLEKNKELLKKQTLLKEQRAALRQKNAWIGITIISSCIVILFLVIVYRTHQKLQQEKVRNNERIRIAGDLHDGLGALLSAVKMNYILLGKYKQLSETQNFKDGIQLLDEMRDEMRTTAYNLMPQNITQQSLADMLHHLCKRMGKGCPIPITLQTYGSFSAISDKIYFPVYRMIEELLNNAVKHSNASEIMVQLIASKDKLHVTVEDDGKGFEMTSTRSKGLGLENLKARVKKLKGAFNFVSEPGMGTCVELEIPYISSKVKKHKPF